MGPFLKWPGGKRWLVSSYPDFFERPYRRYVEPFLGAGSVFFHLRPKIAVLGDLNSDVINTYEAIKADPVGVQLQLEQHHMMHCRDHYYEVRDNVPSAPTARAARIIYLNRTCFNGIYRVNQVGDFNVPIGTRDNVVMDTDDFEAVGRLLETATLHRSDFEPLINDTGKDDLLFLDPPYTVRHNRNGFVKYNEKLFSWEDQERLAKAATRAAQRGVQVVMTNASHDSIRKLYGTKNFKFKYVSRFSSISASSDSRKSFEELVIIAKPVGK
ncbi:Modification methylase DpnIIA [Mycobacteroides abscessus subsp. abscessus]|nr:Modification methylase DpnIIA [Mycobacteroides abscessus subsp. abscessus]